MKSDLMQKGFSTAHKTTEALIVRLINTTVEICSSISTLSNAKTFCVYFITLHLPVSIKIFQNQTCQNCTKHVSLTLANCITGMLKLFVAHVHSASAIQNSTSEQATFVKYALCIKFQSWKEARVLYLSNVYVTEFHTPRNTARKHYSSVRQISTCVYHITDGRVKFLLLTSRDLVCLIHGESWKLGSLRKFRGKTLQYTLEVICSPYKTASKIMLLTYWLYMWTDLYLLLSHQELTGICSVTVCSTYKVTSKLRRGKLSCLHRYSLSRDMYIYIYLHSQTMF